ncbi:phosphoesterase [Brevundimonas sp. LM2]|uniref:phosphoesterase n=1 Tax=Brevundimonas sp. LM2 TaxID=1938605 RepID=UPI000983C29D|nr:phosphoesterase [Brevundimonas sp. LM2]AQR61486.1 phosphoesterase [Brevundimonas sp. LM2]
MTNHHPTVSRQRRSVSVLALLGLGAGVLAPGAVEAQSEGARWLAGDHHVHSRFSATYTPDPADPTALPRPTLGGDGPHTIVQNGAAAGRFGLRWMVSTDHGGPGHSVINAEQAYPELLASRRETPGVIQFYGMELDTPGSEHSSLIIPIHDGEREMLRRIESTYGTREPFPANPGRDTRAVMLEALRAMDAMEPRPIVIANHPSRSAEGVGVWGEHDPVSLRAWHDAAPRVAIGMEGAPGHQATGMKPDGARGIYRRSPTMGGFDQMTATLGGVWDAMLGEGRRWWITATSDSHRNHSEGGDDFWPGEYSKTYVHAVAAPDAILAGLRSGRVFVTTGDLVSELDVTATQGERQAQMGGSLTVPAGSDVAVTVRLRDPAGPNASGRTAQVRRVDLIVGDVEAATPGAAAERHPSTRVAHRFAPSEGVVDGDVWTFRHTLRDVRGPLYLRVRGTAGDELEPTPDPAGEDPWSDLWFYGNPVFIVVAD